MLLPSKEVAWPTHAGDWPEDLLRAVLLEDEYPEAAGEEEECAKHLVERLHDQHMLETNLKTCWEPFFLSMNTQKQPVRKKRAQSIW
jgi:hypothetical protein